ncbi:hypothetical protein RV134_360033 [Roseovarius sp. EC-HK134]|nr:hypothetical protein RV134_360033 [Roseovarius sp. EC-HK134]VVT32584.1 hypothetical protein RV420_450040 [Roseovarius sp. EC-SD190]
MRTGSNRIYLPSGHEAWRWAGLGPALRDMPLTQHHWLTLNQPVQINLFQCLLQARPCVAGAVPLGRGRASG